MPKDTAASRARRSRGEGAITELPNGRFRGAIWLPDADGNQRRKFVRGRSRAEVSRKTVGGPGRTLAEGGTHVLRSG
jgi:hypothetical protein